MVRWCRKPCRKPWKRRKPWHGHNRRRSWGRRGSCGRPRSPHAVGSLKTVAQVVAKCRGAAAGHPWERPKARQLPTAAIHGIAAGLGVAIGCRVATVHDVPTGHAIKPSGHGRPQGRDRPPWVVELPQATGSPQSMGSQERHRAVIMDVVATGRSAVGDRTTVARCHGVGHSSGVKHLPPEQAQGRGGVRLIVPG